MFLKNLELPSQPLDQKLNDFDKEKQNIYEKYDSKRMQKQDLTLYSEGIAQNWNPVNPELVIQLKASAMPPKLAQNLEAKIGSQKCEIQALQRDLQTTQDSLNCWDEVHLNSIQGVRVDGSVATSTSSVNRYTERAISHPLQARSDLELFLQRENTMPKSASRFAAAPRTPQARISKTLQWQCTILLRRRLLYHLKKYRSHSDSP